MMNTGIESKHQLCSSGLLRLFLTIFSITKVSLLILDIEQTSPKILPYLLSVEVSTTAGWELSLGSSVNTSWLLLIFSACQHTEIVPLLPITDLIQLQFSSHTWRPNKATTDLVSEHTKSYLYC